MPFSWRGSERGVARPSWSLTAWALASLVGACDGGGTELSVDLRTDFVPAVEFARVRTTLRSGDVVERESDAQAAFGDEFGAGRRIADFSGLSTGSKQLVVSLLDARGRQVVDRVVAVTLQRSTAVIVVLTRSCLDVECPSGGAPPNATSCFGGRCVPPECASASTESCGAPACERDAQCIVVAPCARGTCVEGQCLALPIAGACGPREFCNPAVGCAPYGTLDAGAPTCTTDTQCDDSVPCTVDRCESGTCTHVADDARCTAAAGGSCSPGFGCSYPGCSPATCVAGACQTARCEGETCVRTPACTAGQICCGGTCAAPGCEDGDPCTDDACGASGCTHAPSSAACSDGIFCNGSDSCTPAGCTMHAGSPCVGATVCSEATRACTGCVTDADCPTPITGPFGSCGGFSGTCDESGTHTRTVTTFRCTSGACVGSMSDDVQTCSRSTTGAMCASPAYSAWGTCGGYSDACDTTGVQTRTRTDSACAGGSCAPTDSMETQACTRTTDGASCGGPTFGGWGACGGFANECDETGTQLRTRADPVCAGGGCTGSAMSMESQPCSRVTTGDYCDDLASCRRGSCSGGSCALVGSPCTQRCCEPGICIGASMSCP